jgi:hypothetical protein
MNIYSQYITYDKITSPITGYSTGRITKLNINKFGFDTVDDLLKAYPNFPTSTESYRDKQIEMKKRNEEEKRRKYVENAKKCKHCNESIAYEKRNCSFCCRSCANSFNNMKQGERSEETKNKISNSVKNYYANNPDASKKRSPIKKKKEKVTSTCVICSKQFFGNRKTCSKDCLLQIKSSNALTQEKHGGGKKGRYKGIYCDSSWELAFLIYHLDKGSTIIRCEEKRSYLKNGVIKTYIPDFVVNGEIFEIKGFMSKTAKLKAEYNKDIILITEKEIKTFIEYVKVEYEVRNVEDLYEEKGFKEYKHMLTCKNCKKLFKSNKQTVIFCSHKCSCSYPKSEEQKIKISNAVRENHKTKKI